MSKNIDELIVKIQVEQIDILKEMEVLNKRMRDAALEGCASEEKIKAYDIGVKNTMSALESLITHAEGEKDRLIYQKYGEQFDIVRYRLLKDVLKELQESGQLHLTEECGGDDSCQPQ